MSKSAKNYLVRDASVIALSVVVALLMVKTKLLIGILSSFSSSGIVGSFVTGLFFTSIFTTAPAIVTFGQISSGGSIINIAFFGAIGAVLGDLVIFRFIRDDLADHMMEVMKHEKWWKRVHHLTFHLKYFRWITFLIGGIIIASPLPDELGISLLGLSKMKTQQFLPISFAFNFIGILIICAVARSI